MLTRSHARPHSTTHARSSQRRRMRSSYGLCISRCPASYLRSRSYSMTRRACWRWCATCSHKKVCADGGGVGVGVGVGRRRGGVGVGGGGRSLSLLFGVGVGRTRGFLFLFSVGVGSASVLSLSFCAWLSLACLLPRALLLRTALLLSLRSRSFAAGRAALLSFTSGRPAAVGGLAAPGLGETVGAALGAIAFSLAPVGGLSGCTARAFGSVASGALLSLAVVGALRWLIAKKTPS